jgi:hypothetical protein
MRRWSRHFSQLILSIAPMWSPTITWESGVRRRFFQAIDQRRFLGHLVIEVDVTSQ